MTVFFLFFDTKTVDIILQLKEPYYYYYKPILVTFNENRIKQGP